MYDQSITQAAAYGNTGTYPEQFEYTKCSEYGMVAASWKCNKCKPWAVLTEYGALCGVSEVLCKNVSC